ncbi:apolipoprotein D-like [Ruditapes philippinarum]|uniref:apolipoprotein D-like n=1 Tax=Ruditapes philippinarum TaxID=129788 RepID=UPI00295AE41B|nr:apolipoprotein D-like [Ruditapes philippinarum]
MKTLALIQVLTICVTQGFLLSSGEPCQNPPVAANFTANGYQGLWYEIGKMQTAGGAAFEKDCVCTTIDISPVKGATNGDSTAINSCRKLAPSGDFLNATGNLVNEAVPGHWKERFFPFTPKADYRIIYLDDHLAIEYDCTSVLWMTNYCVHLLARTPSISDTDEKMLLDFANNLDLNKQNVPYQKTKQDGCW